ncbi:transposase [Hathewaya massiliensis]|uniref:transposase n=1 Tax=Hathewaya massiliensis TaxID=1964382 RepID=UPI0011576A89|nr:transposase [Hathewaya massiliensis]
MAKSKYETNVKDKLILVGGWARNGLTDEQIAKNLGIGLTTFYKYKKEHSELSEVLKKGKEVIDFEVENALLKRALGYRYKEVTKEISEVTGELEVTKEVEKEVLPDTTAQIFWLKNRKPQEWRDKQDIEHSGNMKINSTTKLDSILEQLGDEDNEQ